MEVKFMIDGRARDDGGNGVRSTPDVGRVVKSRSDSDTERKLLSAHLLVNIPLAVTDGDEGGLFAPVHFGDYQTSRGSKRCEGEYIRGGARVLGAGLHVRPCAAGLSQHRRS